MQAKIIILIACAATLTEAWPIPHHETSWISIYRKCLANELHELLLLSKMESLERRVQVCVMKEAGTMTEDGIWKVEEIIELIPKEEPKYNEIVSVLRTCAQESTGDTHSETAMLLLKCLKERLPCEHRPCTSVAHLLLVYNSNMIPTIPCGR